MMKRKFGITVSAMILALHLGSPLAAQQASVEQLNEIAAYLATNDVEALRAYILLHPDLLEGDAPLAALLREFMEESVDVATYLGFEPDLRDAVTQGAAGFRSEDCLQGDNCLPPEEVVVTPVDEDEPAPLAPEVPPAAEAPPDASPSPATPSAPVLGQAPVRQDAEIY